MSWTSCAIVAVLILLASITVSVRNTREHKGDKRFLSAFQLLFVGIFFSVFVCLLPILHQIREGSPLERGVTTVLSSLHMTFQVFTFDVDREMILENIRSGSDVLNTLYSFYLSVLFIVAPLLTFGFIFSFFRNLSASARYILHYFSDLYVFSDLNEKSLALAGDIKEHHPDAVIIFADVNPDEKRSDYIDNAGELGAICFRKGLAGINLYRHSGKAQIMVFAIAEDEAYNINIALKMIENYRDHDNIAMYVFSTRVEGDILLTKANKGKIKIRRVNEVRSLIYSMLYEDGLDLFRNAKPDGDRKKITAAIVGMGQHGTEMLKALAWYCQMDGYKLEIHAFEKDPTIEDRLISECPDLLSEKYNGVSVPGEAEYTIRIHPGIIVETNTFIEEIRKIPDVTYVLVSLGADEMNIRTAVDLRKTFERMGVKPVIQTIVYSTEEMKALAGVTNYRGQPYQIDFVGDLQTMYSEKVILFSELEKEALDLHLRWGKEDEFWQYEYNYRSCVACAIHIRARRACGIPGTDKAFDEQTAEERRTIAALEHRRWNAYLRGEGYIYSGSREKSSRNDLGKMHHDLVAFDLHPEAEQLKDNQVADSLRSSGKHGKPAGKKP